MGTAPPCEQVLQSTAPPALARVSPPGRPSREPAAPQPEKSPGRRALGAGRCRTWARDPGAVPTLRHKGTKEAMSPSQPGEGGAAERPDPVQSSPQSGRPAGRAAPGAGAGRAWLGPPGPPWSLPRASATRPLLSTCPRAKVLGGTGRTRPSHCCVGGGRGHTPATSDPRGEDDEGALCTRSLRPGAQLTLGVTCQVPLSVTFLHLPTQPAGPSRPHLPSVVFLWPRACLHS